MKREIKIQSALTALEINLMKNVIDGRFYAKGVIVSSTGLYRGVSSVFDGQQRPDRKASFL